MSFKTTAFHNAIRLLGFQPRIRKSKLENQLGESLVVQIEKLKTERDEAMRRSDEWEGKYYAIHMQLSQWQTRALSAESSAKGLGEELREQVELNEELIAQRSTTEIQVQGHSALVDASRVQVLTQFTMRSLDLRNGLLNALLSPFAFNVAKHLVKKLQEAGGIREGKNIKAADPELPEKKIIPLRDSRSGNLLTGG